MADADRVLKILLQMQADVSGARQVTSALNDVKQTIASTEGPSKAVADQLAAVGAFFDPITKSFKSVKTDADSAAKSTKDVADSGLLAGASLNKAKGEAIVLARELATGSVNARTVGALLGSLGSTFALGAVGAFTVFNIIKDIVGYAGSLNKEIDETTDKIAKQLPEWNVMAGAIRDAAGAFNLTEQIGRQMLSAEQTLDAFRTKQLAAWRQALDVFAVSGQMGAQALTGGNMPTQGPQAAALAQAIQKARVEQQLLLLDLSKFYQQSVQTAAVWESIKAEPFVKGIQDAEAQVEKIKQQIADFGQIRSVADFLNFIQLNKNLDDAQRQLALLRGEEGNAADEAQRLAQALQKANLPSDPAQKVKVLQQDLDNANKQLERMGFSSVEAAIGILALGGSGARSADELKALITTVREIITLQTQLNAAKTQETKSDAGSARKDLLADLRQQENLIQSIRQQEQLINDAPFLSTDEKSKESLQSMLNQIQALKTYIDRLNADKLKPLDPAQLEQVNGKIQQTQFELDSLKQKVAALQQPLRASLVQWANQFDSTTKQLSTALTGTLNTAIGGTAQALTGLVTGTKNWQQAFAQAGQSIIQQLIQIALQYVVSKIVMAAIDRATGQASGGAATAAASKAAAAWAPAATSASIASYGAAVTTGVGAYVAGLAVGEAAAVGISGAGGGGGFESGGYTGDGGAGDVAGIVHRGEYVFSKMAVSNIGVRALDQLHHTTQEMGASRASGGNGGGIGGGGTAHAFFFDRESAVKWLLSHPAAEKHITDVVHRRRVELGIRS